MRLTPAQMLDDAYLAERAKLIDPKRAQDFGAGHAPRGGTIYLSAADESGMMVSFIQSNYMGFGSGVVVPGWGVSTAEPRPRLLRSTRGSPNVVAPGKRPFHTIIPAFLTKDGQPQMSFGVMGGNMQPQGHLQTLVRMLDHGQQPQAACDAPRWRFNQGLEINVEAAMPAATVQGLLERGHEVDGHQRQLPGLRCRPVHLAARRSGGRRLRRRQRPAARRPGRGLLSGADAHRGRAPPRRRRRGAAPSRPVALWPGLAWRGRLDRLLRQGDHRQARLPVRRRRGHAHHVPHAVRAAAVRRCWPGGPGAASRR